MSPFSINIFLLLGTIIGAGIFSLPIALRQSGWLFFFGTIIALAYLLAKTNTLYRDIIDTIHEKHQLPGYVGKVLGLQASRISAVLLVSSTFGALLAYLIIGGTFLGNALDTSSWFGSIVFFIFVFLVTVFGGKRIEQFEVIFTIIKIVLLLGIIVSSLGSLTFFAMRFIPIVGENPFGAYGAILFALTGISIVPELKKTRHMNKSIYLAEFIVLICYILFAVVLYPYLSTDTFIFKSLLFDIAGVFTILSPYLMLSLIGNNLLVKDLAVSKKNAFILMLFVPIFLFLIGMTSFIKVISLTGGVFLGSIVILVTLMYKKKFPQKNTFIISLIQYVFIIGIILEIWHFFS